MKYSPHKVKKLIRAEMHNETDCEVIHHHVAEYNSQGVPYMPDFEKGDLLVTLIGDSPGSIGWTVNLGSVLTK